MRYTLRKSGYIAPDGQPTGMEWEIIDTKTGEVVWFHGKQGYAQKVRTFLNEFYSLHDWERFGEPSIPAL